MSVQEWREEPKVASSGVDISKLMGTRAPAGEQAETEGVGTLVSGAVEAVGVDTPVVKEHEEGSGSAAEIEAYCVKCKKKVPMQDAYEIKMKNGRPALRGTCSVCGTALYRIGKVSKE